ncbi:MAG TPA: hypothetical protein P5532_12820 [Planctomycetota bacterium]|nr:hypothetical protein [Planctomycetota bacterium]HRT95303.1 hypothetical protein [Planctomycetota bacterium]
MQVAARVVSVSLLAIAALLAGCGTPLDKAEDVYSLEESTARKSYLIIGKAYLKGQATEAQMAKARSLYDAYFEAQRRAYEDLTAARTEGDTALGAAGRRERLAVNEAVVTRCAVELAALAKEVTK